MIRGATPPLVTVAIPLYRSLRFLDIITENIGSLDYPNLEILVGDRHLADETVERLRTRFPGDPRMRFITARDELSWVEHYNLLLREGTGKYFAWMPHDDSYPPGYIGALVERLEAAPGSVLAFGHCDAEDEHGNRSVHSTPMPISSGESWSASSAVRLALGWSIGIAMRGVFRRDRVAEAQLWLPRTAGHAHADAIWLFGLALLGRFEFVPGTRCLKRFYPESTHALWNAPRAGEMPRIMTSYLRAYVASRRERYPALAALWAGAVLNRAVLLVNQAARREVVSPDAMRRVFRGVLGPLRWV